MKYHGSMFESAAVVIDVCQPNAESRYHQKEHMSGNERAPKKVRFCIHIASLQAASYLSNYKPAMRAPGALNERTLPCFVPRLIQ